MPKYYCDYCDTYLTHDSPSVRKTHCNGRKHKENVRLYYQKWLEEQVQKLVDDTTAAFKAGKVDNNPFQGAGGAMIPPPANMAGAPKGEPSAAAPVRPPMAAPAPMGAPMPQTMPLMGHPGGGPMGPMGPMMPGMRGPLMGTPMGPPMGMPYGGRPPLLAGPPPPKMARK